MTRLTRLFFMLALLSSAAHSQERIVDIEFQAPLFCQNKRNTISYVIVSFNTDSFSKVSDLAYFTDGYENVVGPDFYSASSSSVNTNVFVVNLRKMVGATASDFRPQVSGTLATCTVTVSKDWKSRLETVQDVKFFQSSDFEVECSFPSDEREKCKSSKSLANKLQLINPANGRRLPYRSQFTYKAWVR